MIKTRRSFLRTLRSAAAVAALPVLPSLPTAAQAAIAGTNSRWAGASDPAIWQKAWARRFTNVLPNPLAAAAIYKPTVGTAEYTISAGAGTADVLGIPGIQTSVWGYFNQETAPTYPGRTLSVNKGTAIKVRWVNRLIDAAGKPLPHLLPIDQTVAMQAPTTGVPLAVHHHGGDTAMEFDGGPDQWSTPVRRQTGPGIQGSAVQVEKAEAITYVYDNQQEASMHWYHDHADTVTGVNVWAGLAGLYMVRDDNERALQAQRLIPAPEHEVALVFQDRNFDATGQFVYGTNPTDSPTELPASFPANSPTHMPEMFGDVILVNGKAWPKMDVEPRAYRFRLLNGADSRFFNLKTSSRFVQIWVIGTDLGFLNRPVLVPRSGLRIGPGERYDVVMDFSWAYWSGTTVDLDNDGPIPYPDGGAPSDGTQKVMRFNVSATRAPQSSPNVHVDIGCRLRGRNGSALLPLALGDKASSPVRRILLGEGTDNFGRILPLLGVYDPSGANNLGTLGFKDKVTETPKVGVTEVWEFWNTTVDAHPVHLHLVQFRIKNRQAFNGDLADTAMSEQWNGVKLLPGAKVSGNPQPPAAWEEGWKDTVVCPPQMVTRIVVTFNRPGKYVYHCHILSHEDHDMMRWFEVS